MSNKILQTFAKSAEKPGTGFWGRFASFLFIKNQLLEKTCVKLLNASPESKVLMVGFNRGAGLDYALQKRTGNGAVYGVDHSIAMCDHAKQRFRENIARNELVILNDCVKNIQLHDQSVDFIFHANCHVFWDDLDAACRELFRILKPGGRMLSLARYRQLRRQKQFKLLQCEDPGPTSYIKALNNSGFKDINLQDIKILWNLMEAQAVHSTKTSV